jgi:hypothetical protein
VTSMDGERRSNSARWLNFREQAITRFDPATGSMSVMEMFHQPSQ